MENSKSYFKKLKRCVCFFGLIFKIYCSNTNYKIEFKDLTKDIYLLLTKKRINLLS